MHWMWFLTLQRRCTPMVSEDPTHFQILFEYSFLIHQKPKNTEICRSHCSELTMGVDILIFALHEYMYKKVWIWNVARIVVISTNSSERRLEVSKDPKCSSVKVSGCPSEKWNEMKDKCGIFSTSGECDLPQQMEGETQQSKEKHSSHVLE